MKQETAHILFKMVHYRGEVDLDIPLNISAHELIVALNHAFQLGIDTSNMQNCYLRTENPIALLHGNKTLAEYGLRNGSVLYYDGEMIGYGEPLQNRIRE